MSYLGSKGGSWILPAIVASMPPHDVYIETHLGSGAVMLAKPPAAVQIGIDLDPELILANAGSGLFSGVCELRFDDCIRFLERFEFAGRRVLVYADPPYVISTRTSSARYAFDYTDADHRRLIAVLRQIPADVILSGYPSELYDELVGDWRSMELPAMTRGGPRIEKLWFSFPAGEVQWATFAGENRTQRQRIKRKAARWRAMYRELPPGERLAVLAALLEEHAQKGAQDLADVCDYGAP